MRPVDFYHVRKERLLAAVELKIICARSPVSRLLGETDSIENHLRNFCEIKLSLFTALRGAIFATEFHLDSKVKGLARAVRGTHKFNIRSFESSDV